MAQRKNRCHVAPFTAKPDAGSHWGGMVLDTQGESPYNPPLKKRLSAPREPGRIEGRQGSFMLMDVIMLAVAETRGADNVPVESTNAVPVELAAPGKTGGTSTG
jgi:hypothetical protein